MIRPARGRYPSGALLRIRLLPLLLASAACMKAPDPAGLNPAGAPGAGDPAAKRPQLALTVPADWQPIEPDLAFYLHKWQLPDGALATISWLGPDASTEFIVQNVQRWLGEWTNAAGEPVTDYAFAKSQNGAFAMHRIELTGTLTGVRQLGGGDPRTGWSLDGVVIETEQGALFFKLIGPQASVAGQRDAVWRALGALQLQ